MPPTVVFTPGSLSAASVSVVCHARYSADRISRATLLSLPAPFFILPAEAALGDLQPVSIPVVPSLIPSVESVAATIRTVIVISALSTRAVSVDRQRGKQSQGKLPNNYRYGGPTVHYFACFENCVPFLTSEELAYLSPVRSLARTKAAVRLRTCSECWWLDGRLPLSLGKTVHT